MKTIAQLQQEKKDKERQDKLLGAIVALTDALNTAKNDKTDSYEELLQVIQQKMPDITGIEKQLTTIKDKKIDFTPLLEAIKSIKTVVNVPAPVVKVPEQKPDKKIHTLLNKIDTSINGVTIPGPVNHKKDFKNLIQAVEDVEKAIKGIKISVSSGGSGGGYKSVKIEDTQGSGINPATSELQTDIKNLLQQIENNTDELEIKADQINLNTDELEAKLDTLNQDKATASKQDEIIQAINNQSGGVTFKTNDIIEDGTDTYFGKESKDGEWYFMKIDANNNFSHATKTNNPTINDYQSAKASYDTLTYGNYSNAF